MKKAGLMLDIARRFHTPDEIRAYIDYVAEVGGSYVQLHFCDNENYAIQSDVLGQVKSHDNPNVLTFDEVRDLSKYAKKIGIELIPELEFPAHSTKLLDLLFYKDWDKWNSVRTHEGGYQLHTGSPETYDFIVEMVNEILDVFPNTSVFHLGGDEFEFGTENTETSYIAFMNRINTYLIGTKNVSCRIWNDAITKTNIANLSQDISVVYWSITGDTTDDNLAIARRNTRATMQEIMDHGNHVINSNSWFLYTVPKESEISSHFSNYAARDLYQNWDLSIWDSRDLTARTSTTNLVDGAMFCVWSEEAGSLSAFTILKWRKYHIRAAFDITLSYNESEVITAQDLLARQYKGYIDISRLPLEYDYYIMGDQVLNLDNYLPNKHDQYVVVLNGDLGDKVTVPSSYHFEMIKQSGEYLYYRLENLILKIYSRIDVVMLYADSAGTHQLIKSDFCISNTVISQYANSPIILDLLSKAGGAISADDNLSMFYTTVFNIDTASGIGLDYWGKIVGIERGVLISRDTYFSTSTLSFSDLIAGQNINPQLYKMNDEMYRAMIKLKAFSNLIYATAPNINILLSSLFRDRGRAYYVKSGTMKARYVFEFILTNIEKAIMLYTELLPKPTGVLIDFYEPDPDATFGFDGTELSPFNQGAFYIGDQ